MESEQFTVSQVNSYLRKKFSRDHKLKNIYIKGEISNYKSYSTGHDYFTLKDENSQISAVLYKGRKKFVKFKPEDGMNVIVKGSIEVYEKNGNYQLKVNSMKEDGVGDLHVAFEQLKKKLQNEGLFDVKHKKEIPKYPQKIGVITSQTGAAIKDIITTINRRYPKCEIYVFSTLVQGNSAAPEIVKQIKYSQKFNLDTIIIGRGGGSIEDLWPFNEEMVAREIFNCRIPIISAVGHEIDYTISDFVADLRAPTPTAAAELAVPEITDLKSKIYQINNRLNKIISNKLEGNKDKLENICNKQILKNPETIYEIKQMHLDHLISNLEYCSKDMITQNKNKLQLLKNTNSLKNPENIYKNKKTKLNNLINNLNYSSKNIITQNKNKLEIIKSSKILKNPDKIKNKKQEKLLVNVEKLEILNPLLTLKRGYSITKSNDKVVTSVKDVKNGDKLNIEVDDGTINTKVI